ncbi:hypothetical protein EXE25_07860 [Acinetobacter bouvetii]|uniref:Uncharacterized protein n=2 Tax=Acinetobacter TaxID=469 RepID=A0A2H9YSR1_9GAMM|nr:hypothetical protein CWI32_04740 [Acinetobacter pseudolwoffii]RZG67425.1 hypothetical protein EXE25_07860 [Acinetobacter bouvetii]
MMTEDSDFSADEVGIKTMLQCNRGNRCFRIFAGVSSIVKYPLTAFTMLSLNSLLYVLRF